MIDGGPQGRQGRAARSPRPSSKLENFTCPRQWRQFSVKNDPQEKPSSSNSWPRVFAESIERRRALHRQGRQAAARRRAAAGRDEDGQGLRRREAQDAVRRQDGRPPRQQGRRLQDRAGRGHALSSTTAPPVDIVLNPLGVPSRMNVGTDPRDPSRLGRPRPGPAGRRPRPRPARLGQEEGPPTCKETAQGSMGDEANKGQITGLSDDDCLAGGREPVKGGDHGDPGVRRRRPRTTSSDCSTRPASTASGQDHAL